MRHQQRAGILLCRRPRETRECFRARPIARHGVAGREHDPVGIELELGDLTRGQEPVVEVARLYRNGERQRRLGEVLHVAGNQPVSGKVDNAVVAESNLLYRCLTGISTKMNVAWGRSDLGGDRRKLNGGFR